MIILTKLVVSMQEKQKYEMNICNTGENNQSKSLYCSGGR